MIHAIDNIDFNKFFSLSTNITRNNGFKLEVNRFLTSISERFFSYSIINPWNSLPSKVVSSSSLQLFKINLDEFLPRYIEGHR
jgi:superfamily I DNA and/or RNA helicase